MIYIGIDPGKTGGAAGIQVIYGELPTLNLWPSETLIDMGMSLVRGDAFEAAIIEIQQTVYLPGGKSNAKATSVLMRNFGRWEQWLLDNKISSTEVRPAAWQKIMLAGHAWKGRTKEVAWDVARKLFPSVKITKPMADAVCIAEFCRRCNLGTSSNASIVKATLNTGAES